MQCNTIENTCSSHWVVTFCSQSSPAKPVRSSSRVSALAVVDWLLHEYLGRYALDTFVVVTLVVTSGLLAGFFFAWWCSCMIGLREVGDEAFVEFMQAVNRVLPNGRFVIPFFAPVVLAPIAAWIMFSDGQSAAGWWSVAATALSVISHGITVALNVPLNNSLEAAGRSDDTAARTAFEAPWNRWNDLRTGIRSLRSVRLWEYW